jgi:hypothetical protein
VAFGDARRCRPVREGPAWTCIGFA